ncbi:MAG: peptidase [Gammaproteobacteria bacterium]|nr:peptidase [Gammaproteobacteria bacterium]
MMNTFHKEHRAICFELPKNETDTPPEWVLMLPAKDVIGWDKRTWKNSHPDRVISEFNRRGMSLPFDIEHATELKASKGDPAPAVGWVTAMENRNGEVWTKVEWNKDGIDAINSRQYRFYSPAFSFNKKNREIISFTSFALTNKPNLEISALNQAHDSGDSKNMDKIITAALGLNDEAASDAVLLAINSMKAELAKQKGLAENPSVEAYVPIAEHEIALNRVKDAEKKLADLETKTKETAIAAVVDAACAAGKLIPAEKEDWLVLCRQMGVDEFKKRMDTRPVMCPPSGLDDKTPPVKARNRASDSPPPGYLWEADPNADVMLEKALNYMQTHADISFDQAVLAFE